LNGCWQDALRTSLSQLKKPDRALRAAIVGVGHELRGDDAAGLLAARALTPVLAGQPNLLVLEGGPAPENLTGALRRFQPDIVLLLDAAQFDAPPGTVRWLDWRAAAGFGASTHAGSLNLVGQYLSAELDCQVALLGIQLGGDVLGAPLTPAVAAAVSALAHALGTIILAN
jgi:hydrogenase maturation protease